LNKREKYYNALVVKYRLFNFPYHGNKGTKLNKKNYNIIKEDYIK